MAAKNRNDLSPARRRLLEMMSELQFGHIDQLVIRAGEPVLDPLPPVVREFKFGADPERSPDRTLGDFVLKKHVLELYEQLDVIWDGVINRLEVKHGLPFRALIGSSAAA